MAAGSLLLPGMLSELLAEDKPAASVDPLAPKPPHFSAKAKRVIYIFSNGGVSHMDTFDHKPARKLFPLAIPENVAPYPTDYAVSADGQRILVNTIVGQPVKPSLTVILNWASELARR